MKHYGFSTEERILSKVRGLWARERNRITREQMFEDYSRLLREDSLVLEDYYEVPFWVKHDTHEGQKIEGLKFGFSKALRNELKLMEQEKGLYSKEASIYVQSQKLLENSINDKKLNKTIDAICDFVKTKNIVHINLTCDPAGVSWLLHKSMLDHGYKSEHLLARGTVNHNVQQGFGQYIFGNLEKIYKILDAADVLHINVGVEDPSQTKLDLSKYLKTKPFIIHNHGGPVCLDPYKQINPIVKEYSKFTFVVCSPITKYIVPDSTWLPNVCLLNDPLYLPIEDRDFNSKLLICHKVFSQNAGIIYKGDKVLSECVNDFLAKDYPVQLDMFYGQPAAECLTNSATHHICIDNLTQGFIGMAGWESLAKGQAVIARLDPLVEKSYADLFGSRPPIINVSGMDEMCHAIRDLNKDRKKLERICNESRTWMEANYTEEDIVGKYAQLYYKIINQKAAKK